MIVLNRLLRAILTLWVVVTVVFIATRFSGDPTRILVPPHLPAEQREEVRERLGLNEPIATQYVQYLGDIARGDFGVSFFSRRPVVEIFFERVPDTLRLTAPAFLLSTVIGVLIGVAAALWRNSWIDRGLMAFCFVSQAVPNFVLGIVLLLVFSLWLQMLPSAGNGTWRHYFMPVIALSAANVASVSRLMRAAMADVLNRDFIRFARSKGLPPRVVIMKHALRNSFLPVLTILGLQIGALIGGAVVVETVFAWPGAGRLFVDAILARDYPLLQFGILVFAASVILANMMVDMCYRWLDPRMRIGAAP